MTRINSLYRSQTSPVVWCIQKVWLAPELLVSMGPGPHLSYCVCKTTWLASEFLVSKGPSNHLWFLHAKQLLWIRLTSLYGSQTSPVDLWTQNSVLRFRITLVYWSQPSSVVFVHSKQRLLHQNLLSPWVPAHISGFCMQNSDFRSRITRLYRSQTSPTVFFIQNEDFSTGIASLYGSQPSSEVFACKTATFGSDLQVSMGPSHHLWFCA